jgi:aspartate racemase
MKKPGLLGGIGPESTIEYYRLLIKRFQKVKGTTDYPEFIIHNINMTQMLDYIFKQELNELTDFLVDKIKTLEAAGAEYAAMASNTPHIVFDELQANVNIPLISIVVETVNYIKSKGVKRVALLGTKSTMTSGFYQDIAEKEGIEIVIPKSDKIDKVHSIYMNELVLKIIKNDSKQFLLNTVKELKETHGIEGVILGGTELPLILNQVDFADLTVFDTTQIHVEALLKPMLE